MYKFIKKVLSCGRRFGRTLDVWPFCVLAVGSPVQIRSLLVVYMATGLMMDTRAVVS